MSMPLQCHSNRVLVKAKVMVRDRVAKVAAAEAEAEVVVVEEEAVEVAVQQAFKSGHRPGLLERLSQAVTCQSSSQKASNSSSLLFSPAFMTWHPS